MKKTTALLVLLFLATTVSFAKMKQPAPDFVRILHSKKHTLFIKVNRFFVGGTVEIYSAKKKFLEADVLPHELTKIFFDDAPSGKYIIKVKKGKMSFEFEYKNS
ncbi:hypothetical protein WSM22_29410 [Cytophagales bacterium WSM2-2]|nr:hypothetical protein WSM22_29410 [Cytophagales bacterium WSM2-2]